MRPDQLQLAKQAVETWKPQIIDQAANRVIPAPEWTSDLVTSSLPIDRTMVAKTQTLLTKLGYDTGPADGIMGTKTREAIAQFQERVGLNASGEITAELLQALEANAA